MTFTPDSSSEVNNTETLVWEASALLHACRSDRCDVLLDLATRSTAGRTRHVTTAAVAEELKGYDLSIPTEIEVTHVDGLDELISLASWVQRLSSAKHDRGEATVCAWAQVHHGTAIIDDREARLAARRAGLEVHGSAWVVGRAVQAGIETPIAATRLMDLLISDGARYPFRSGGFTEWAKAEGFV